MRKDLVFDMADRIQRSGWCHLPAGAPHAAIMVLHGLGEHAGRYHSFAETFLSEGIAVLAYDHRGHGDAPGRKGAGPWPAMVADVTRAVQIAKGVVPGVPLFLFGHSLGGLLAICHLQGTGGDALSGVIAQSPAFAPARPPGWVERGLLGVLRPLLASVSVSNRVDRTGLAQDSAVAEAYGADPLVHDRITIGLALEVLTAGEAAQHAGLPGTAPLLLVHGEADRLTSFPASDAFAKATGCEFHAIPGGYHELHNDTGRGPLLHAYARWILKHR